MVQSVFSFPVWVSAERERGREEREERERGERGERREERGEREREEREERERRERMSSDKCKLLDHRELLEMHNDNVPNYSVFVSCNFAYCANTKDTFVIEFAVSTVERAQLQSTVWWKPYGGAPCM